MGAVDAKRYVFETDRRGIQANCLFPPFRVEAMLYPHGTDNTLGRRVSHLLKCLRG